MRRLLLALALPALALSAFAGEGNEAAKLFRDMEKRVAGAKSLRVSFASTITKNGEDVGQFKGSVDLGDGNKGRFEVKGQAMGKEMSLKLVADGEKLKATVNPPGEDKEQPLPKNFGQRVRLGISRVGPTAGLLIAERQSRPDKEQDDEDVTKRLRVSDFKLGADAEIGGRKARVLEYKATLDKEEVKAKLWLDARTHLPLKRELSAEKGGEKFRIVETYSEFNVGAKGGGKASE
jgi:outer membrane lipoprotein-sorting protein